LIQFDSSIGKHLERHKIKPNSSNMAAMGQIRRSTEHISF